MTGRHRRVAPPTSHRWMGGHGQWVVPQQRSWEFGRLEPVEACPRRWASKAWPSEATQALLAVLPRQRTGEAT